MKKIVTILCALNSFIAIAGQSITLNYTNPTLKTVFTAIENRVDLKFAYEEEVNIAAKIPGKIKITNASIEETLTFLNTKTDYTYVITGANIIVLRKKGRRSVKQTVQQLKIRGKVTDEKEAPLPGVNIVIEGTTAGTQTDFDGNYSIKAKKGDVLQFSYVGFKTITKEIKEAQVVNVVLASEVGTLEEVVVVGFGTQKKKSVVGALTSIKPSELKIPSSNLTTALAGRIAGIISYQRSGEPGADNAAFFIRGLATFGYKKDPLILIDDIEVDTNTLAQLQPDDVESFSIMKDATATAIYGARGANGVIYIKTKSGKEGKPRVSVRIENSWSLPTRRVQFVDPITYMSLHNEAVRTRDPLGTLQYSPEKIANTLKKDKNAFVYPTTDWYRLLFKKYAMNQRANFSVSGGGKVARYYIAGGVTQDNGNLKVPKISNYNTNINLRRYNLRSNIDISLTRTTKTYIRFNTNVSNYRGPLQGGANVYIDLVRTSPVLFPPFYEPDSASQYKKHILFGNYDDASYKNPYADMVKGYKEYSGANVFLQLEVSQNMNAITQGLSARAMANIRRDSYFNLTRQYNPFYYQLESYDPRKDVYTLKEHKDSKATEYLNYKPGVKNVRFSTYVQLRVNYRRIFGENHSTSAMLVSILREGLSANQSTLQKSLPSRNLGISGRLTYGYKSRYFVEFNFGYNGSERFSKNNRFGFFPSVGVGWIVSGEPFWKPLSNVISRLKLRGSFGWVGNDAIGSSAERFFYLSEMNMDDGGKSYFFGEQFNFGRRGVSVRRYPNPNIGWEISQKANLGIELNLFGRSLDIIADFYSNYRSNILMTRVQGIPVTMGIQYAARNLLKANIGEASSKGIDFSVNYRKSWASGWWFQGRSNFTYATSRYEVYEEPDYAAAGTPWRLHPGNSLSQSWGYVAERLFVDDEETFNSPIQFGECRGGDIKYKDINGDDKITDKDMVPIGFPTSPEIVYGFGFSTGYKNWDMSAFFQGLARESFWVDARGTSPFNKGGGRVNNMLKVYSESYWSEENKDPYAIWPRLSTYLVPNNYVRSTWFMYNGSLLRLKTVELGYRLPQKISKKMGMGSARIYLSGINLFTLSKFKLWDVEMGGNGLGYPIQQVFNLGLHINF